jgi:hypothetical protein
MKQTKVMCFFGENIPTSVGSQTTKDVSWSYEMIRVESVNGTLAILVQVWTTDLVRFQTGNGGESYQNSLDYPCRPYIGTTITPSGR